LNLSLRAKFLLLSAVVQALVLVLLIANGQRVMGDAVSRNAARVAHEYAVTLNLTLSPYASEGRLDDLSDYWSALLDGSADSFLRYIVVLDEQERPLASAGRVPAPLPAALRSAASMNERGMRSQRDGTTLHVRTAILLNDNRVGSLNFGLSTDDLAAARDDVLVQSCLISLAGLTLGVLLFYAFTAGIGRRLSVLSGQSARIVKGAFGIHAVETGGDEIDVFTRSLHSIGAKLRERVAQLEESERLLSESEARFKTLFDLAPLPLSVSYRSGHIVNVNQALTRKFGYAANELIGRRSNEVRFWAMESERERIWQLYMRNGTVQGELAQIRLADGEAGQVAIWSSSFLLDGDVAIIWALLDQTEEIRAKNALKELNTSLETRVQERSAALEQANADLSSTVATLQRTQHDLIASEKMASLGSLVAGIAHELNTPIGNSLLASTTLGDRVEEFDRLLANGTMRRSALTAYTDEVRLACNLISNSLHRAANLISSFKQIAVDQTSDQRRVFNLKAAVLDTAATYLPRLRRAHCSTTFEIPATLTLDSYPGSWYQIFNNLLNNALAHAFELQGSGTIAIRAEALPDDMVEIVFGDDGCGMSEDVRRHVFDPFFTTKMGRGGTGLGMNIVYNIVTGTLGGRVTIESTPGMGTTVRIVVPLRSPLRD